jgi:hypothetical protein
VLILVAVTDEHTMHQVHQRVHPAKPNQHN